MQAMLQTMLGLAQSSADSDNASVEQESNHHPTQVAVSLASSSNRIQLEMLHLLKELSMDIKNGCIAPNNDRSAQESECEPCKTPKEGRKMLKNMFKYC